MWARLSACLAIVVCGVLPGCASHRAHSGGSAAITIGDSVCGMLARFTFAVVDARGTPITHADVWQVQASAHLADAVFPTTPIPDRATHLGSSDDSGRITTSHCYASMGDIQRWRLQPNATRLSFLVMHEEAGYRRVAIEPPLADVWADGNVLAPRPGRGLNQAYTLNIEVALPGPFSIAQVHVAPAVTR